ncbi:MAG: HD domain-containing protein [Thermoanaerobaculales bacterium]|nr:HD domain-containing protein [Thermoanaerobaculales bacterium]
MAITLPGWSPDLERSFKEVLFRFLEEVHCTKAALYLLAPDGSYLLATQYGFGRRDMLADRHGATSPIVLKTSNAREKPLAINHRDEFSEFSEALNRASTTRMLLVPVCGASRLAGFVDARDKGRKHAFEESDVSTGAAISNDLLRLIRMTGVVEGMDEADQAPIGLPFTVEHSRIEAVVPGLVLDQMGLSRLHRELNVEMARETCLTAIGLAVLEEGRVGVKILFAEGAQEEDRSPLLHHQAEAMRLAGFAPLAPDTWLIRADIFPKPVDTAGSPRVVGSEVVLSRGSWCVVVSVIGMSESGCVPRVLGRMGRRVAEASAGADHRFSRRNLARGLLRPGGEIYRDLEKHALATSRLSWLVTRQLGGSEAFAEEAALTGLLHDLGMVDLDYERLYRHPSPGSVEKRIFRGHSEAGERRLGGTGLESVADAVRHHHERWDGEGYPDRLAGEKISILSRIVHAAEVFDVLTSTCSYRRAIPADRALAILQAEADRQFDPAVVEALTHVIGENALVGRDPQ